MPRVSQSSEPPFQPDDDLIPGGDLWRGDDDDPFAERSEGKIDASRLPPPDSLERMAQEELDEIAQSFRRRLQRESRRLDFVLDTDYWCVLCFQTREQLLAFLDATGWRRLGERYVDGLAVARALGIELPSAPAWPRIGHDPIWEEFVVDPVVEESER